jgi:hypothetical protein
MTITQCVFYGISTQSPIHFNNKQQKVQIARKSSTTSTVKRLIIRRPSLGKYKWALSMSYPHFVSRLSPLHSTQNVYPRVCGNSLNFYLPKNNRCYENYVYLSNIPIRSFVLLAYPLLFLNLCIFCKKSCYVIIMGVAVEIFLILKKILMFYGARARF